MTKTLLMDGKIPVTVDCDDFELAKLLLQEHGLDHTSVEIVVKQFRSQPGYTFFRAADLVLLAKAELQRDAVMWCG